MQPPFGVSQGEGNLLRISDLTRTMLVTCKVTIIALSDRNPLACSSQLFTVMLTEASSLLARKEKVLKSASRLKYFL